MPPEMSSGLNLGKTSAMLYVYQQNWRQHLPLTATRCELPRLVVWGVSQEMTSMLNRTIVALMIEMDYFGMI